MRFLLTVLAGLVLSSLAAAQWTVQVTVTEGGQSLAGLRVGFVRTSVVEGLAPGERVLPEVEAVTDAAGTISVALPFEQGARRLENCLVFPMVVAPGQWGAMPGRKTCAALMEGRGARSAAFQ